MLSLQFARRCRVVVATINIVAAFWGVTAYAQRQQAAPRQPTYEQQQEKVNAWTVGLRPALIEGAPLRLAAEMARVTTTEPTCTSCPS